MTRPRPNKWADVPASGTSPSTPNLDRLAAYGALVENAYRATPKPPNVWIGF